MHGLVWSAFIGVVSLWGGHGLAEACSCSEPPPAEEALRQADAVFIGTLSKFELIGHLDLSAGPQAGIRWVRVATFDVTSSWKGSSQPSMEVTTGAGGGDCGVDFIVGRQYLVYASVNEGTLQTNICTRTRGMAQAQDDLAVLGQGTSPTSGP